MITSILFGSTPNRMEQIQNELLQLRVSENKKDMRRSLMDVIGSDRDTTATRPVITKISQSQDIISAGGLTIAPNSSIQLQLNEDSVIHYLQRYAIAFTVVCTNGYIENAGQLFESVQADLGQVSLAFSNSRFYQKQRFINAPSDLIRKWSAGMCVPLDMEKTDSLNANAVVGNSFISLEGAISKGALYRQEPQGTFTCVVPLWYMFPFLLDLESEGAVYGGLGQKIRFNMRCASGTDAMIATAADPTYSLSNMALIQVYSKLDGPRNDMVLKQKVHFPISRYSWYGVNIASAGNTINMLFNISQKERVRGLFFAFHPLSQGVAGTGVVSANTENIVTQRAVGGAAGFSRLHYPLAPVRVPIKQIDLDLSGEVISWNMQQLQWMHLHPADPLGKAFQHPIESQLKCGYYLDLTRCADDEYGSSGKDITVLRAAITLQAGGKSIYGQNVNWSFDAAGNGVATFNEYSVQSFLVTQQMLELNHGLYTVV